MKRSGIDLNTFIKYVAIPNAIKGVHAPILHCSQSCSNYRNKTEAAILKMADKLPQMSLTNEYATKGL